MHDQIRDIIQNGKSDQATPKERQELLSLFHQPEIELKLKSYLFEDLDQIEPFQEDEQSLEEIFEKFWKNRETDVLKKLNKIHVLRRLVQMVAILAIGLFLGYILDSVRGGSSPVYYTSVAPKGSVSELFMPDGTHVFLNSGSEIKYSVEGVDGTREVFLGGEALFEVAKMKGKPFLVHTPSYDIRVTGTIFNVKANSDESETVTTLVEGTVQIESSGMLQLANKIELKPGEQLIYRGGSKKITVQEVNTTMYTAWKDNRMVFVNMDMKELKTLLERKFGVEIEIRDESILQYHYDGTFRNETIFEVLEVLKLTLPIQYHIEDQKIIINPRK